MNQEELIQQCRKELEDEITKLYSNNNNIQNDENVNFSSCMKRRIEQIVEKEINFARQLILQSEAAYSCIPLQRVVDNFCLEFEKQIVKPLQLLEQAFEKCFVLFYETLWNTQTEILNEEEEEEEGQTISDQLDHYDIGIKISERGNHVEINYWSLMHHGEDKMIVPYDLKNVVAIFKELLITEMGQPSAKPISVFNFLFKLDLHIEKIKFLTLVDECKGKDSLLMKSICVNRCFLDRDTILNMDENNHLSDEDHEMIFHKCIKNFEIQREETIDKIVGDYLSKIKIKDEGLNLVCGKGITERNRERVTAELLQKESLYLDNKLSVSIKPTPNKSSKKVPTKYIFEPIEIPKEKKQEKFIDFVYKSRGFKVYSDQISNMKFASIIDKNTTKGEKKPVPQFNLPITPKTDHQGGGVVARTVSTLFGEYVRNVALKNNAFDQFKRERLNIMQNRLGDALVRDHHTTLIIKRMRNRLKYLLSQPNHKVSVEKKEEAIIGFLRMLSQ